LGAIGACKSLSLKPVKGETETVSFHKRRKEKKDFKRKRKRGLKMKGVEFYGEKHPALPGKRVVGELRISLLGRREAVR